MAHGVCVLVFVCNFLCACLHMHMHRECYPHTHTLSLSGYHVLGYVADCARLTHLDTFFSVSTALPNVEVVGVALLDFHMPLLRWLLVLSPTKESWVD